MSTVPSQPRQLPTAKAQELASRAARPQASCVVEQRLLSPPRAAEFHFATRSARS